MTDPYGDLAAAILLRDPSVRTTWDDVVALSVSLGHGRTRQCLCRDPRVSAAYAAQRKAHDLARAGGERKGKEPELDEALRRVVELKAQLVLRDATIREYDERFARYLYNAREHGISLSDLEAPMRPQYHAPREGRDGGARRRRSRATRPPTRPLPAGRANVAAPALRERELRIQTPCRDDEPRPDRGVGTTSPPGG